MKFFYLISFAFILITACKKDKPSAAEIEYQKLEAMKKNLIKDWKIVRIMTAKPQSQYGTIAHSSCEEAATFSFYEDHTFNYAGSAACYGGQNIKGEWSLPKSDSLFIRFTGNWIIGVYENLEVSELTANTMKWNILASTGNGNPVITQEWMLVPR